MCIAIPARISKIEKNKATVRIANKNIDIDATLLPNLKNNDWVLIANNTAVRKISAKEATNILQLINLEKGGNI